MPPKVSLLKLTQGKTLRRLYETQHMIQVLIMTSLLLPTVFIQDLLVPLNKLATAIQVFDKELDLYPLWLCPFKLFAQVRLETRRSTNALLERSPRTEC